MPARIVLLLLLIVLTVSCGDDDTPTRPDPIPAGPTITCPANVSATTTTTSTQVAYAAPTVSGGTQPVTVVCAPASGSTFPLGTTTVSCTATDAATRQAVCGFSVNVTKLPTLQRTTYLAFGDSVTAGEVTTPVGALDDRGFPAFRLTIVPTASYPTQLQALLRGRYITQQQAIVVTNAGVPGERATTGAQRFPSVMAQVRPEVALLLEGYNDLSLLGNAGINPAAAAIESMSREARGRGARVFIASLTPPRAGGRNALPVDQLTAYNSRLRSVAIGEGAVYVDLYQALLGNVSLYIGVDGLHPTEVGYQKIAETFFEAIRATLETP